MIGNMWDALTLTSRGLYNGKPKLMIWRYVDTKVKDNILDILDNLMNIIISISLIMASMVIRFPSKNPLTRLAVGLWYI